MPGHAPGFSFALHLLRAQGFYFALLQYSYIQSFTGRFVPSMQLYHQLRKTAHRALHGCFRWFGPFQRTQYSNYTSQLCTDCATLEGIPSSAAPPAYTRYQRRARTLYRSAQTVYYNNVYKRVQHIADHARPEGSAPAVCGSLASADTLSAVQQQEGGGRSGTIDGYRRISFRAVAW